MYHESNPVDILHKTRAACRVEQRLQSSTTKRFHIDENVSADALFVRKVAPETCPAVANERNQPARCTGLPFVRHEICDPDSETPLTCLSYTGDHIIIPPAAKWIGLVSKTGVEPRRALCTRCSLFGLHV